MWGGQSGAECNIYEIDDDHADLIEIDENLARTDMTAGERISYTKRRQIIWNRIHGKARSDSNDNSSGSGGATRKVGYKSPPIQPKKFAAEVAAVSKTTKGNVNKDLARAEALGDDLNKIMGTSLDKVVEMDALIKLPEPERKELIEQAASG